MLLNPFLLYATAAWGQFDSVVALLALSSLVLFDTGKLKVSAILLALAISFKPIALPLVLIPIFYLKAKFHSPDVELLWDPNPQRRIVLYRPVYCFRMGSKPYPGKLECSYRRRRRNVFPGIP